MQQTNLFCASNRYKMALRQKKIWSNFPPSSMDYDIILKQEKIAILPFSVVKQLEIGDLIQFTGKTLKVLKIEETKAYREVLVTESICSINKKLFMKGFGVPISFEVAQKMGSILLEDLKFEGLLKRSQQLLNEKRNLIDKTEILEDVILHRLENGLYRYETFLGSIGNFILYHIIKEQLSDIEGIYLNFDELGIESNRLIPFESLKFPYSVTLFEKWAFSHLQLLKETFSWNGWIYWLPLDFQTKEITTRFLDYRILEKFEGYQKNSSYPVFN